MASHSTASSENASDPGEATASARSEAAAWVEGEGSSFAYSSASVSISGGPAGEGVQEQAEAQAGPLPEPGAPGAVAAIPPEMVPDDPQEPLPHALSAEEAPVGLSLPPFATEFGFA